LEEQEQIDLLNLREELEKSIKTGMQYFFSKIKQV